MNARCYLVLIVQTALLLGRVKFIYAAYQGCYQDSPVSRELYVNPGNYDPSSIDATECENLCGRQGYGYAGLTAGKVCLCGQTITSSAPGICDVTCPGDITQFCGTSDIYDSVYTAPVKMTGFKIVPAKEIMETYALSTINFNITGGTGLLFNGTIYDGGPSFGPLTTQLVNYNIRRSGEVGMTANVTNDIDTMFEETALKVQTRVKKLKLSCEETVVMQTRFDCYLTVAMGTNLNIEVDMGDGKVYTLKSPGTKSLMTGQSSGITSGASYPGDMLYFMPEHTIPNNGTLAALEFRATATGLIYVQVYRPFCAPDYYFCPKSSSCILNGVLCNSQPSDTRWKQKCGSGTIYSLVKRECVDMSTGQLVPRTVTQDWSSMPMKKYTLVGQIDVTITTLGQQFYEIPDVDLLSVEQGDVMALNEPTGRIAILTATGKNYEFYYDVNSDTAWGSRLTLGYNLTTTPSILTSQHALKTFIEKPSRIKFRHTFLGIDAFFNVTATVQNDVTNPPRQDVVLVEQLILIADVHIEVPYAVATNESFYFNVSQHNGTKPVYTWDFGNGEGIITTERYVQHTYNETGVYTVTFTAKNAVNSITNTYTIIVQDPIQNLTVEKYHIPSIWGNLSTVLWNITQGTNVTYKAIMGDGIMYIFSYPFIAIVVETTDHDNNSTNSTEVIPMNSNTTTSTPPVLLQPKYDGTSNGMEGFISHLYLTPDFYTFMLIAENDVSTMNITFIIPVQDLITGFLILPTSPIPFYNTRNVYMSLVSGSHLEITAVLNSSILNITSFDETAGTGYVVIVPGSYNITGSHFLEVNMTNLVSPIVTYSIEVWIDYLITNLSIDIDRSYIPVGDQVTFVIGMYWCSRFTSYIDFMDSTTTQSFYYDVLLDPETFNYTHSYFLPGVYPVNFTIQSPIDYHNSQHDIYVQYGVKNVDVKWTQLVRIEPGASGGTANIWLRFMGGVPMPTMASYFIDFDDNSTSTGSFDEPILPSTTPPVDTTIGIDCEKVIQLCKQTTYNVNSTTTETTAKTTTASDNTTVPGCPLDQYNYCMLTIPPAGPTATSIIATTMAQDFFSIPISYIYTTENTYNVSVNISNLVSYMFFTLPIEADKPIYGLVFRPYPPYVPIDTNGILNISMSWGSRATCTFYIGDGSPVVSLPCDHYEQVSYSYLFSVVGVYHSKVFSINSLGSVNVSSSTGPIIVQIPVTKFSLRCPVDSNYIGPPWTLEYKRNVSFELVWDYQNNNRYPTNASYTIDFGDGIVSSPELLPTTFEDQNYRCPWKCYKVFTFYHTYVRGGNYSVNINIWNLVSDVTYSAKHDLYEGLVGLGLTVTDFDSSTNVEKLGGGPDQNYFAQEHQVKFVASLEHGSHVTYKWTYGDTMNATDESFFYKNSAYHMYTNDICYTVKLVVENFNNSLDLSQDICIQRGCFEIGLFCDNPRGKNSTFVYQIHPGMVGSNACYMMDLSNMADPNRYIMFGDATQCSTIPEWNDVWNNTDTLRFDLDSDIWYANKTANPSYYNITLDSTFIFEGYYDVSLKCQNKVSNEGYDFRVGVTKGPCWWPLVNVTEPNTCDEPMCDPNTPGLKTHYKSLKLIVNSNVVINCTATKIAFFWWQVYKIDENSGNETAIVNLNGADVYSIGARQLVLEPRTLDYGLYRFRLNVSMNEVIGMVTVDECFIRIIATPLTIEISGGDFMMRRWGDVNPLNIDALTYAYDPDVDPSDKSGMTFIWTCRRLCETWPVYNSDWTINKPFTTNCTYSQGDGQNDRGCSKVDGANYAGILPNASSGILNTLYPGDMYENDEVEIKVYVIKGDRRVSDSQNIFIAEGDPPIVGLNCITNCGSKVNTDSRYSLATYVDGWTRGVYFYYKWILFGVSWTGRHSQVAEAEWNKYASAGMEGPTMAILPNCDRLQRNVSRYYYFRVQTWRWGTSVNLCGWASRTFYINERPSSRDATITVTPTVGVAYETKFNVRCRGFKDYENGYSFKLYKFGYRADYSKPYVWFYEGRFPYNDGSEGPIPDGLPENSYKVEIIARAYDQVGAFADKITNIRVDPANQQDVANILASATSETGIVNNLFVGADIKIAPVAKVLGKFLNEEADSAPSDQEIIATTLATNMNETARLAMEQQLIAERGEAKVRRTETRAAILDGFKRIKAPSLEAVQNTAAALSELTKKQDELTETAQDDATEILQSYTNLLRDVTHVSADDREETATTMVEALGNLMHAAGHMSESAEDQSTSLYNEYYSGISTTPSGVSTTTLTAAQFQAKQNELDRQKTKGKEIYSKVEAQTDNLIKTISTYKVVGEKDAILESPKLNITLRKRLTIDMNDKPLLEVGGFSSVLMPKSQSIFGDTGNETTFFVATEALRMTNNPFTWTDTTAGSAQKISSDVVSLRYRNDSGLEVPVEDNSQMFDIFVDRTNFDTSVNIVRNVTRAWDQSMVIHSVNIENTGSLHIKLEQILNITDMIDYIEEMFANIANNTNDTQTEFALELKPVEWYVFVKANEPPTTTDYDFNCTLPLSDDALAEMLSYIDAMNYENDTTADRSSYIHEQPDSYTCFFTNDFLSINETTKFYIGIKHLVMNMSEDHPLYWHYYSTAPPTTTPPTTTPKVYTTTCKYFPRDEDQKEDIKDWLDSFEDKKKRGYNGGSGGGEGGGGGGKVECTTYPKSKPPKTPKPTQPPPEPAYKQAVYRLSIFSAYCIWWDRTADQWSNEGCEVGPLSTPDRIHCLSSHLTSFAAGFAVPMNTIDLNDSAFTKLDENPIIFCTMVSLMCLYVLMCIWARKRDLMDKIMAGSSPLPDNDPRDKYLYEIQVFTGSRKGAGTTAKVSFILTGEKEETSPRFLADEKRPVLQASNIDGFVMAVPKSLGKLTHLRIWHDNMGSNPPWYFSRMQIEDLQTGDKYFFVCENWLSLDDDDGLIDRMIPVAGRAELTSFNYLFWTKTKYSLADGHLWFSIFKRPAKSNFTRIQRLTCCLSLLFATMVTSIAFYKSDEGSNPKEYGVGPIVVTPTGLYIGLVSGLMSLPINLLIVALFRYSKPYPKKIEETLAYRFYSKFLCFACVKKKVHGMDEKQKEEVKNNMVENAKKERTREKSDLDPDAVKVELENELEMLERGESFEDKDDTHQNDNDRSVHPPPNKDMKKPSAELNPIPRALTFKKDDKTKKPFKLPYWGIYIGYVISFCTVAVAFWATVEFGGVFGPKKSLEWLVSFFISCFESIFFSQPLKVIIIAVIYAVFIKKPEANDDDNDKQLEPGEEWLHSHMTEEDLKNPDKRKELEKMKTSAPLPPELDFLKTAREERAHEMAMYSLLKEIAICVFFLYFVLMIAYSNRDPWSYNQYSTYNNMFNLGSFSPSYTVQFDQVNSIPQFWNWTQNALLNSLYYTDWYNGDVFTDSSSLIQDKQTLLVGSARLRQLRTIPYKCVAPLDYLIEYCRDDYSSFSEDKKDYKLKWDPLDASDPTDIPDSLFSYSQSSDIDGYPYWGIFSTYGGGGYVADLGTTMTDASAVIDTLMENNWVDNNTRAIFIEVNLYNPNNNLFGICLYVLEFLQTGGIEPFERFFIFRLDRYSNGFMYFVMAIELITMAFVIFYTVTEVKKIRKLKKDYFKEFWNVWELVVLAIAYGLVLVFIYRSVISVQMMKKVKDNPTTFVNFFFAIVWDECCGYFIGILAFMETLRFLRLLRFNKKVSLFTSTMMYVAKPLLSFGVVFMSGFLAFSTTAYFFFNTYMFDFRTFVSTLETLLSMMLGKFDYEKAWTTTRVAGPIIFGMFALCFNFILVNFFLTIVIDGFEVVKSDLSKQSNDYEVVDHMMKKVKMLLGIDVPRKRKTGYSMDPRLNIYTYIEGKTADQELCDELDGKVQSMIERCNTLAEFPEDEDLENEIQELKTKKKKKIIVA